MYVYFYISGRGARCYPYTSQERPLPRWRSPWKTWTRNWRDTACRQFSSLRPDSLTVSNLSAYCISSSIVNLHVPFQYLTLVAYIYVHYICCHILTYLIFILYAVVSEFGRGNIREQMTNPLLVVHLIMHYCIVMKKQACVYLSVLYIDKEERF